MPVGKRPPEKGRSSDGVVLPREEPSAGSIFHAPEFDPARVNRVVSVFETRFPAVGTRVPRRHQSEYRAERANNWIGDTQSLAERVNPMRLENHLVHEHRPEEGRNGYREVSNAPHDRAQNRAPAHAVILAADSGGWRCEFSKLVVIPVANHNCKQCDGKSCDQERSAGAAKGVQKI
jgi:hypothetical protein